PYDDDPLFAYLWRRGFATAQFSGGRVARILDRMVAEFIGYSNARPNYAALLEIPLRLREHATARRKAVLESQAALAELERRAMIEAGSEVKETALAETRHKLAVIDDTVEKKRDMLKKVNEARTALVAGDSDPGYKEALTTIADADAADSLASLYAKARQTPTEADDLIIGRLAAIDGKITGAETEIANLRREAIDLSRRRSEIEKLRERFRGMGYDHPQSTFGNDGDIANMLKGMLEGAVRSGVLWD